MGAHILTISFSSNNFTILFSILWYHYHTLDNGKLKNQYVLHNLQFTLFHTLVTLYAPTPQNGQTYSNNFSAITHKFFGCVWHFVGLTLKGLSQCMWNIIKHATLYFKSTIAVLKNEPQPCRSDTSNFNLRSSSFSFPLPFGKPKMTFLFPKQLHFYSSLKVPFQLF